MLEIPESTHIANQLNQTIRSKRIEKVIANASLHKYAFYFGDPNDYDHLLRGKTIGQARTVGGFVEIEVEDNRLLFGDGVNIRYYLAGEKIPAKNQLQVIFTDHTSIVCSVQMYGSLLAYPEGQNTNEYYLIALEKPSPLTDGFDETYFHKLLAEVKPSISIKAFLATEQRIPGLGNGVLQDILFSARIHPKSRLEKLTDQEKHRLFRAIKEVLSTMTKKGGRDTEKDLFGQYGGYQTVMSKNRAGQPCPVCEGMVVKESFLGGSIYVCPNCQPIKK